MGSIVSGDSLFVARWGDGPDVVFLHGLGASSRYWEPLAAASSGYRATAPDLLGFGRSPSPPEASYDVDCHLGVLMPQLPRRAVVVAHSTGAILAAALAARHPDRVASMLLLGLPAYPDEEAARRSVGGLGLLARLTVDGSPAARWVCLTMGRFRSVAIALAPWLVRDLPSVHRLRRLPAHLALLQPDVAPGRGRTPRRRGPPEHADAGHLAARAQ